MGKRLVIGCSGKRRVGKDTVCIMTKELLADVGQASRIDHFAYSIKEGIGKGVFGFSEEQLHGCLKTVVDPFWGITPRDVFQRFGTEVMHTQFGQDIWARTVLRRAQNDLKTHVLVGDVRFPHEVGALRELNATLIRIDRAVPASGDPAEDQHLSETALDGWDGWDHRILNNGSIPELRGRVAAILCEILAEQDLLVRSKIVNGRIHLALA